MKEAEKSGKEAHSAARIRAQAEPPSAAIDPRSAAGNIAVQELLRSGGAPLDPSLRSRYEQDFNSDFSAVRVHTDGHADVAAHSVRARAFALGNDVAFAAGAFDPQSYAGLSLLTHELTHVEQQAHSASPMGIQRLQDAGALESAPSSTGVPLVDIRAALAETNSIAGVGNFPKAFTILNGLSMHDLLWTLDALAPIADLQILDANIGSAQGLDVPRLRLAINVVQNLHRAGITDPGVIPESISADDQKEIQNYIGTVTGRFDSEALNQAADFKPTGNSPQQVLQQLSLIERNLDDSGSDMLSIDISPDLELVKALVRSRHDRLATSGDHRQILKWGPQVAAQLDIVVRAGTGLAGAKSRLLFAKGETGRIEDIPPYLRHPLMSLALAFAAAIRSSDYARTGYQLLAHAEELAKTLEIEILKETLEDTSDLLKQTKTMSQGKVDLTGRIPQDLGTQLETARSLLDKDPEKSHEMTQKIQEQIADLHKMATAVNMAVHLSVVDETMREAIKKCTEEDELVHVQKLLILLKNFRPLEKHWQDLRDAYIRQDNKAQENCWKVVRAERAALSALLKNIDDEIKDAYHDIFVSNLIFHLTVLVLIGILTWGAGLFFEAFAGGLELAEGGLAAGALITGGEALTFTVASTALLEKDRGLGKFGKELLLNWITFGAMRGLSAGYRLLFGDFAKTLPGAAGELITLFTVQTGASLYIADKQKRAATGQGLTDAEIQTIVFEGIVVSAATMIAGRVAKDFMPEFQGRGGRSSARLAEINKLRAELRVETRSYVRDKPQETARQPQPGEQEQRQRLGPEDKEKLEELLQKNAESLKLEQEFLEEVEKAITSDPSSKEAQQLNAAKKLNTAELEKNQTARFQLDLEAAGPNEILCDQGTFDELVNYEKKREDVSVAEGRDSDGARNVVVTPKPPSRESPLRITEKLATSEAPVTIAPEPKVAGEVPLASEFKPFEELLNEDGTFNNSKLEGAYKKYEAKKKAGQAKTRKEWSRAQTSSDYRPSLETELGSDFFKQAQQLIDIRNKPRPRDYTPDRYLADEAAARVHIEKILQKAGIKPERGIPDGKVTVSAFNGAKGKVAEILARTHQADVLAKIRVEHPNAVILRGVKIRYMKGGAPTDPKLYTDDLIGEYVGNDLYIYGRFEVKSGPSGGYEATVQFHTWVEKRLAAGSILQIPGRPEAIYGRTSAQQVQGKGAAFNMTNAPTYIISARNTEHLGLESEMQTTTEHHRVALDTSADEIEYLTRILLEPYITPKTQ